MKRALTLRQPTNGANRTASNERTSQKTATKE